MNSILRSNIYGFILMIIWIFGSLLFEITISLLGIELPKLAGILLPQVLFLLIPTAIYFIITKQSIKNTLRLHMLSIPDIITVIGISLFIQPLMMLISAITSLFFNNEINGLISQLDQYPLWVMILLIAFVPGILEEITMRGVVLSGYDTIDIKIAALASGLFFGMLHLNFQQFFYAFVLGILFAVLVRGTNSIFASIIAHMTINGSQILLATIIALFTDTQDLVNTQANITILDQLLSILFLFIWAGLFTPLALFLLFLLLKRNGTRLNRRKFELPGNLNYSMWPLYASLILFTIFAGLIELSRFLPKIFS